MASTSYRIAPGGVLSGTLRVPGDKSISHRSVMLGAIAQGTTEVSGFLHGADTLATVAAMKAMGVVIEGPEAGDMTIRGGGLRGLRQPAGGLDLGNSGTGMRLLAGLLAGQGFSTRLEGDESLSRRPMGRVTEPLEEMGARIHTSAAGTPPLEIHGMAKGDALRGIRYSMPVASAQVKSCLLLAGLYAHGPTTVIEPGRSRDHTERMLRGFGVTVDTVARPEGGAEICMAAGQQLEARTVVVPGDISSAAFFLVGASIAPGSSLRLEGVGMNPTRTGALDILRAMGGDIQVHSERESGGEPVADLVVSYAPLFGVEIQGDWVPRAIDEFPVLFVAASLAQGTTRLRGARELRVKESDRIAAMARGLTALGAKAEPTEDGMVIQGLGGLGDQGTGASFDGATVDSEGDHRIAMALSMAALRSRAPVVVENCANVATSYPGFPADAGRAGLALEICE